jgi:hypothetical protein
MAFLRSMQLASVTMAIRSLLVALLGLHLFACGDDGSGSGGGGAGGAGGAGDSAGVTACRASCDAQLTGCPTFAVEDCNELCDAFAIGADTDACDTLLAEWKTCEASLTYTCAAAPNQGFAVPSDPDGCDAESDAYFADPDC